MVPPSSQPLVAAVDEPSNPSHDNSGERNANPMAKALAITVDYLMQWRTLQQFFALYQKNFLVSWRNRRATLLRLLAPFLFLILALIIDKSTQANNRTSQFYSDIQNPAPQKIGQIPKCSTDLYIGTGKNCTEILYSPDNAVTRVSAVHGA